MTHANTPAIQARDPRGLPVRSVAYHHRDASAAIESYVTQQIYDASGRALQSRDPRLFLRHQLDPSAPANQSNVFSLSGSPLLSENTDAGWRLSLIAADGFSLEGWDQKRNHRRTGLDSLRRPSAIFEHAESGPEHCTERFTYGDESTEIVHNRRGRLIRHDDTAGTLLFAQFSLTGLPLQCGRAFCADPVWAVNWPETRAERDHFLEGDPATTFCIYNAMGELISQTDALGNRQTLLQDRVGQLREIHLTLAANPQSQTIASDIQYNAEGHLEHQRAGNGVVSRARFGADDGRLQHLLSQTNDGQTVQDLTYEYDASGNITRIADHAAPAHFHRNQRTEAACRYRYDSLSRLIEASGRQIRNANGGPQLPEFSSPADPAQLENYTRTYTYDCAGNLLRMEHRAASGNRTERTAVAHSSNRSLGEKPDGQLPDEGEIAARYDASGNRLFLQHGKELHWDRRNELRQVSQIVRADEPDDIEFYVYDGGGQRQRKITQRFTGTLTRDSETRYLPGLEIRTEPDQIVHVISIKAARATLQVLHWAKGLPAGMVQDQQRYSFSDHLNSSTVELDAQAQLISREDYYPYGETCWWAGRSQVQASYKTLRYSGKERDATGLYYYGFRYYAPWLQRWLNADPLGTADGLNLFAMVHGNPVGNVDFQGLVTVKEVTSAALATFARDGVSALAGSTVRYFAAAGLAQWASGDPESHPDFGANVGLTIAGSLVGAAAGGSMGIGLGSRVASHYNLGRTIQIAMAGFFGLAGATIGAAAPAYAYFADSQAVNLTAISILASTSGNMTRETAQRALANVGPSVTIAPSGITTALRMAAYGGLLSASGAARADLATGVGVVVSAAVEGLDGVSITTINSLRGGAYVSPEHNTLTLPRPVEWVYGVSTRTAGSTLTASLTLLATPLTSGIADSRSNSTLISALGTPTEARTYVGQYVERGAFELVRADDADFTLDRFTPPNRMWRNAAPADYHPETPHAADLPMQSFTFRRSH
ncbi:RHS repeat-associated core domain-containing protein [Pseudomonas rustica]|uniref:RHS repeat-associated core domain-containing protein n=1 Tax=Pseudomonas rustica TaxID=2827099 RepID=UPI001BB054C5|nr:RHS repeat-associated core domain-containing protein [Pseudomonas rustica]MBS4085676.1 RHS repeat-associated core domain-containing protein [Pseudomonas rustica]